MMAVKWAYGRVLLGMLLTALAAGSLPARPAGAAEDESPHVGPPHVESPHVGPQIEAMLQADWLEQDRRFTASRGKRPVAATSAAATQAAVTARQDALGKEFSLAHTADVLHRAEALAVRLAPTADPARLQPLCDQLAALTAQRDKLAAAADEPDTVARRELFFQAKRLARNIAFANPLLDFDKLLFIKRHDPGGPYHMCDQYYGCNAIPGGGLFVLNDPFGDNPRLANLLADVPVENGRLEGQVIDGGGFVSPEVSYDGRTIMFAHSQCKAPETYRWGPEFSYHLFSVNALGTNLRQLTDGDADDFDPCFLPNGRVAFVSSRRGGYLRCGRHCPVYTLHSMRPDGTDIIRLSHHETHEWHPSVDNNGMIVYTRWDYVDRDTNVAHHLWTCFPDGRDPRSMHGNYPVRREDRPWMEMSIRAIPGSPKFVATAAAHHGHAFGSLVLIDPRSEDDAAMSQLERLTPEVPFPEASGRGSIRECQVYATPWPLSEDDYLCSYDPASKNHALYWIDRFGNKELIYRDASIPCLSPIPLRPRPMPPVIPDRVVRAKPEAEPAKPAKPAKPLPPATVAVMNVYDSDFAWPSDAKVDALRIIQVLPKTTPPPNVPRIGVADQTNARAVLGTVPVESDGSAHFTVPAGKAVYFQAVDGNGMAIQSMRSATYLQPGETLTCVGCHEPKHRTVSTTLLPPLALQRAPSKIRPDVSGSNPFSYVRLVQPVLDRQCVGCHRQKKALDLAGTLGAPNGWTRSYANLAGKYGFYFNVRNGSINDGVHGGTRTTAGKFGARASKLLDYMDQRHYGVKLSAEEYHRLTLWLDCNSEFYGAYENTPAQSRGEIVMPSLD